MAGVELGYKGGIIAGLLLVALGGFWFIPATHIGSFWAFLLGVCMIAAGLTFLETIANPYATVLGAEEYGATRINLAQSCNGIGLIFGPIAGGMFFYSKNASGESTGSENLWIPYAGVGVVVIILAIVFYFANVPDIKAKDDFHMDDSTPGVSHSIWSHPHFVMAVIAQFLYVAAQAGIFSFFINYVTSQVPEIPSTLDAAIQNSPDFLKHWLNSLTEIRTTGAVAFSNKGASNLVSVGLLLFLGGRFIGTALLRKFAAHKLLGLYGAINTVLCLLIFFKLGWIVRSLRPGDLFLYVDHVPDHFCAGNFRSRAAGKKGILLSGHGHHGRRDLAKGDGSNCRHVRPVSRIYRADALLCVHCGLCVYVAQAEWFRGSARRVDDRRALIAVDLVSSARIR